MSKNHQVIILDISEMADCSTKALGDPWRRFPVLLYMIRKPLDCHLPCGFSILGRCETKLKSMPCSYY